MLEHTHNSRKRYTREARDTHQTIYTLRRERSIFPIFLRIRGLATSHDDSSIIIVKIAHCKMHRILIDNGSFSDLLYLSTLLDMDRYGDKPQRDYVTTNIVGRFQW